MNNRKVLSNFIWRFFERTGSQIVQLVVSIVLARILEPTVYGTVAIMNIFINILNVLLNCNLATALVQKKNADDIDFSTVFYAQILFGLILYLILFFVAPWIAYLYEMPELTQMLRVSGLVLNISSVRNIQNAYVSKTLQFKKFFFSTLSATIVSAIVGICMAQWGFGAWALIAQNLSSCLVGTIILWMTVKWRPIRAFSVHRLKKLFSYSWKLIVTALLERVHTIASTTIIGKNYSSMDLAYYNRGQSWPVLIVDNINASIDSVLLPIMATAQDSVETLKGMTRRSIKTSTYVIAPMMIGLAIIGEPLVRLILTEKWLPCVQYQAIFCITYMFLPINTANLNAIKALGRSDVFLKLQIIKTIISLVILYITSQISVMAICVGFLVISFFNQIINTWPNKKLMNYGYLEQLKDILPAILLAAIMGFCIFPIKFLNANDIIIIIFQILFGAAIYAGFSTLFKVETFVHLIKVLKNKK